jgi:hypothetical protein
MHELVFVAQQDYETALALEQQREQQHQVVLCVCVCVDVCEGNTDTINLAQTRVLITIWQISFILIVLHQSIAVNHRKQPTLERITSCKLKASSSPELLQTIDWSLCTTAGAIKLILSMLTINNKNK